MRSVPEMPVACGHQRNAILVAAVDGVLIAQTAARVGNGRDASLARLFHRVIPGEGKECIAGKHRALHPDNIIYSLLPILYHCLQAVPIWESGRCK